MLGRKPIIRPTGANVSADLSTEAQVEVLRLHSTKQLILEVHRAVRGTEEEIFVLPLQRCCVSPPPKTHESLAQCPRAFTLTRFCAGQTAPAETTRRPRLHDYNFDCNVIKYASGLLRRERRMDRYVHSVD